MWVGFANLVQGFGTVVGVAIREYGHTHPLLHKHRGTQPPLQLIHTDQLRTGGLLLGNNWWIPINVGGTTKENGWLPEFLNTNLIPLSFDDLYNLYIQEWVWKNGHELALKGERNDLFLGQFKGSDVFSQHLSNALCFQGLWVNSWVLIALLLNALSCGMLGSEEYQSQQCRYSMSCKIRHWASLAK